MLAHGHLPHGDIYTATVPPVEYPYGMGVAFLLLWIQNKNNKSVKQTNTKLLTHIPHHGCKYTTSSL